MKVKSNLHRIAVIWGILFTTFLLLSVGSKIIMAIFENPGMFVSQFQQSIIDPIDPSLFFYTYILGYILIWWKPLWGAVIIILISIYYVAVAGFDGPPIFAAPGFVVGVLYLTDWFY